MATSQPKYFEKSVNSDGSVSYLFVKRMNPKQGTFPHFKVKAKLKMAATTEDEAIREARALVADLDLLQEVARKDGKHITSTKDKNKAAATWCRVFAEIDLDLTRSAQSKKTREGVAARDLMERVMDEVIDFYETRTLDHEGSPIAWLTEFGDHLLKYITDGQGVSSVSDGVGIYLRQTQRDHLPEKDHSVRTVKRVVGYFIEEVGDKQLDQISRRDVERYIEARLKLVKTTSVERELRCLCALWNKCANVLDLQIRNPFSNQPIKGLGSDSIKRHTPTLEETQRLLRTIEEKAEKYPKSYVWPLVAISALTGLRLSEAWGLDPADFKADESILLIRPNSKRSSLKTANSNRPIPVLPPLDSWLERYFSIVNATGGVKTANSASSASLKALKNAGFKFGNHSLRHGMKQRLVEADAPQNIIEELMGWSSQSMAKNYGQNLATASKKRFLTAVYLAIEADPLSRPVTADNVVQLIRSKN